MNLHVYLRAARRLIKLVAAVCRRNVEIYVRDKGRRFIPLPRQVLGEFGGRTYMVYDVLPWTLAVSALRSVLTYGTGLSGDVILEMAWLIFLTAILFIVGVLTYAFVRLEAEK